MTWADDLHLSLLRLSSVVNRPDVDAAFLAQSQIRLDRALFPLLVRVGRAEATTVVELAGGVGRNHSTVSRQIAKLETLGLIARKPAEDQRVRLLTLTDEGNELLATIAAARRRLFDQMFADWSRGEREQLVRLAAKLADTLNP